jgi:predicted O-methyltransferase YrrM
LSLEQSQWTLSLSDPNNFYLECLRYFDRRLPDKLRAHRAYFTRERRGFGDDGLHVMWFLLFREFKPKNFLEIGVFRGQVISLAAINSQLQNFGCEVYGISPFTPAGDAVSSYPSNVEYYEDTLRNFDHFGLPHPTLLRAYSTDAEALQLIGSRAWDMIYIDGNHDYEVVKQDWESCFRSLKPGGIIVLDDAGLTTSFRPPVFSFGGHPGPSRLADEINRAECRELLQVAHNRVFQKIV